MEIGAVNNRDTIREVQLWQTLAARNYLGVRHGNTKGDFPSPEVFDRNGDGKVDVRDTLLKSEAQSGKLTPIAVEAAAGQNGAGHLDTRA